MKALADLAMREWGERATEGWADKNTEVLAVPDMTGLEDHVTKGWVVQRMTALADHAMREWADHATEA
jgi:hypothetical protein